MQCSTAFPSTNLSLWKLCSLLGWWTSYNYKALVDTVLQNSKGPWQLRSGRCCSQSAVGLQIWISQTSKQGYLLHQVNANHGHAISCCYIILSFKSSSQFLPLLVSCISPGRWLGCLISLSRGNLTPPPLFVLQKGQGKRCIIRITHHLLRQKPRHPLCWHSDNGATTARTWLIYPPDRLGDWGVKLNLKKYQTKLHKRIQKASTWSLSQLYEKIWCWAWTLRMSSSISASAWYENKVLHCYRLHSKRTSDITSFHLISIFPTKPLCIRPLAALEQSGGWPNVYVVEPWHACL